MSDIYIDFSYSFPMEMKIALIGDTHCINMVAMFVINLYYMNHCTEQTNVLDKAVKRLHFCVIKLREIIVCLITSTSFSLFSTVYPKLHI